MKYSDDYNAKLKIWAKSGQPCRMPRLAGFPRFPPHKFSSYQEFNSWKTQMLIEIGLQGNVRWTK